MSVALQVVPEALEQPLIGQELQKAVTGQQPPAFTQCPCPGSTTE
ncbi:MAG: hypothetical protein V2G33_03405 [bacterium JZ-2024 1]